MRESNDDTVLTVGVFKETIQALDQKMMDGFRTLDEKIDRVDGNLSRRMDDLALRMATKEDVAIIHRRILKLEERV